MTKDLLYAIAAIFSAIVIVALMLSIDEDVDLYGSELE